MRPGAEQSKPGDAQWRKGKLVNIPAPDAGVLRRSEDGNVTNPETADQSPEEMHPSLLNDLAPLESAEPEKGAA